MLSFFKTKCFQTLAISMMVLYSLSVATAGGLLTPNELAQHVMENFRVKTKPGTPSMHKTPPQDMLLFDVDGLKIDYATTHPDHPDPALLMATTVDLVRAPWGYVVGSEDVAQPQTVTLKEINDRGQIKVSGQSLQSILTGLSKSLEDMGLMGIYVLPHPDDIGMDGTDLRPEGDKTLRIQVFTSAVGEIITRAVGQRLKGDEPLNHPSHAWIRRDSPLQPVSKNHPFGDLLNRHVLDGYSAALNRHPGRYVSTGISGSGKGEADLEYRVSETSPWVGYIQLSDTGTSNTNPIQKRFGLIHNQLTGRDDILSFDYATAGLDDYNSINLSYSAPWHFDPGHPLRVGFDVAFSEFTSTDVGLPGADFNGRNLAFGVNARYALYQFKEWFVDVVGGMKWKTIRVNNALASVRGEENFLKPHIGLAVERKNRLVQTKANLTLETNLGGIVGTDSGTSLAALGRSGVDSSWMVARGAVQHSFFLEPLLYGDDFRDPSTPETSTLAHEINLSARGQYTFGDDRLIPQEKFVAGGLYSVRGYPQSITSGDSGLVASAEYRLHLPRLLPVNPSPDSSFLGQTFRMAPTQAFGYPDWDLALKFFTDMGWTVENNKILGLETNEKLWSIGLGVQLQILKNLRFEIDYGFALLDLESDRAERGDQQVHAVLTLFF